MKTKKATRRRRDRFARLDPSGLTEAERRSVTALALSILEARHQPGQSLRKPTDVTEYLRLRLGERRAEVFGCMFLDTRHRIIATEEMFQGTVDGAAVYPRVIVQRALELNAAAVVAFHNHPSGVSEPSEADRTITVKLAKALALVEIRLLDHLVVTGGDHVSLAERGWI